MNRSKKSMRFTFIALIAVGAALLAISLFNVFNGGTKSVFRIVASLAFIVIGIIGLIVILKDKNIDVIEEPKKDKKSNQ